MPRQWGERLGSLWFFRCDYLLLALDAQVHLYDNGWMGLKDFIALSRKTRDLLTEVKVRRRTASVYHAFRLTATDLPLINCGISRTGDGQLRIALGARPAIADVVVCTDPLADAVKEGHLWISLRIHRPAVRPYTPGQRSWQQSLRMGQTYGPVQPTENILLRLFGAMLGAAL